jgi:hypothetical protein
MSTIVIKRLDTEFYLQRVMPPKLDVAGNVIASDNFQWTRDPHEALALKIEFRHKTGFMQSIVYSLVRDLAAAGIQCVCIDIAPRYDLENPPAIVRES